MPEYSYKAKDARGSDHIGSLTASTKNAAAADLRDRGWVVLSVVPENAEVATGTLRREISSVIDRTRRVTSMQVELSLQQLALMLRSGMTLLAAIDSLTKQTAAKAMSKVWNSIGGNIQKGADLSSSMSQHQCFPDFVVRQVQIGEKTGNLDTVLDRSVLTMRDRRTAGEAFLSATFYPIIVLVLSVCVTIYMVVYLIPKLEVYLQSLGKQMPAMTQSLLDGSTWLRSNFVTVMVIILTMFVLAAIAYSSKDGRFWIDKVVLRLPLIGRLLRLKETFAFAQSLSTMLKSGITLIDALGATEKMVNNRFLADIVADTREKIIQGSNLADAIDRPGAFTPMLTEMIKVGQQSGELDTVLTEVAELHQSQFQMYLRRVNSIMTPMMTLVIGGVVGYVYIAFFVALFAAGA